MATDVSNPNSIPSLLRDLRDETSTLLRQELALAKTELKENVSNLQHHAVQIAVGGFVAYAGLIVLLFGFASLIEAALVRSGADRSVAHWAGQAIIGIAVIVVGWAMLARAKHAIAHNDVKPRQTIESLRENKEWAQTKMHHSS